MCFWHPALIQFMPDKTLKRLFDTCCQLRENWRGELVGKKAPFFVRQGLYEQLIAYHQLVMNELKSRGLEWNALWDDLEFMGSQRPFKGLRPDYLAIYIEADTPYGYFNEKYLCDQILWLRNHGKDTSKILESLRQKGFKELENLF